MQLRAPGPRRAPVFPALQRARDFLEIAKQHAVRYEARGPMGNRRRNPGILHTLPSAFRIRCGAKGIAVTRAPSGAGASLIAFTTAARAPAVPASPTPFAPSSDCLGGAARGAHASSHD